MKGVLHLAEELELHDLHIPFQCFKDSVFHIVDDSLPLPQEKKKSQTKKMGMLTNLLLKVFFTVNTLASSLFCKRSCMVMIS